MDALLTPVQSEPESENLNTPTRVELPDCLPVELRAVVHGRPADQAEAMRNQTEGPMREGEAVFASKKG